MKVVILAGGYGTRLSEETRVVPKPLVEIGGRPILWHIMKLYSSFGLNDFVVCCGYKGDLIKSYFLEFFHKNSDLTIDLAENRVEFNRPRTEPWRVSLVDTGMSTMTGGRIKRISDYLDGTFCLTYGDGVTDLDIGRLVAFHRQEGAMATVTAVQQRGRFGVLGISKSRPRAESFREKHADDGHLINGGFFVLEPQVLDLINGDDTVWEDEPMQRLVAAGQLAVFRHAGFWQNMDTLRDKALLQELWDSGNPPWRVWDKQHDIQVPSLAPAAVPSAIPVH